MGKIIGYITGWFLKKGLIYPLYYSLATVYFLSMVSMITAFFVALDYFITLIRNTLSMMTNYTDTSGLIGKFYGVLSNIGFTAALNDASPVLVASIVFLLSRVLIAQVNKVFEKAFGIVSSIMQSGL